MSDKTQQVLCSINISPLSCSQNYWVTPCETQQVWGGLFSPTPPFLLALPHASFRHLVTSVSHPTGHTILMPQTWSPTSFQSPLHQNTFTFCPTPSLPGPKSRKHAPTSDKTLTADVPTPQGRLGLIPASIRMCPERPRRDVARDCRHCPQIQESENGPRIKSPKPAVTKVTTSQQLCQVGTASASQHRGEVETHTRLETWQRAPHPHGLPRHQQAHPRVCPLNSINIGSLPIFNTEYCEA